MDYQKKFKPLVLVGTTTFCWFVWLCRNVVVFYNKQFFFLLVIFLTTHRLRTWAILQRHTSHDILVVASLFFGTGGQGFFLPGHMGGGLVLGSTVISVSGFLSNFCRLCALSAEVGEFSR